MKEGKLPLKTATKSHYINLIKKELESKKGQLAFAQDKVNYKGTPDWEKKEFTAVLKDKTKDLKDTEKNYKRVQKLKEGNLKELNLGAAYGKMLDKHNKNIVKNAVALVSQQVAKDNKIGQTRQGTKVTKRLVTTKIVIGLKELRNKSKSPALKKAFQVVINDFEKELKGMKEGKLNEAKETIFDVAARV